VYTAVPEWVCTTVAASDFCDPAITVPNNARINTKLFIPIKHRSHYSRCHEFLADSEHAKVAIFVAWFCGVQSRSVFAKIPSFNAHKGHRDTDNLQTNIFEVSLCELFGIEFCSMFWVIVPRNSRCLNWLPFPSALDSSLEALEVFGKIP
jgi:hypothetical protein